MAPGRMRIDHARMLTAAHAADSIATELPRTTEIAEQAFRAAADAHRGMLGAIAVANSLSAWRTKLERVGAASAAVADNLRLTTEQVQQTDRSIEDRFGGANVPV